MSSNWVLDSDDEKNVECRKEQTKKEVDEFNYNYERYIKLFHHLGKPKSKILISSLMDKVMMFGIQYRSPKRLHFIKQLKDMKDPFNRVFGEDYL